MLTRTIPFAFITILLLTACHKDSTPPTPLPPTIGTMAINLLFGSVGDTSNYRFELIISEPGGKVLLDSIAPPNAPVKTTLKTNSKLVDITTIRVYPPDGTPDSVLALNIYKSVNPTDWVTLTPNSYHVSYSSRPSSFTSAHTVVQNFP
ncbi:MAG TPA: hypothetical protein VGM89_15070, partial [Puia sp.]